MAGTFKVSWMNLHWKARRKFWINNCGIVKMMWIWMSLTYWLENTVIIYSLEINLFSGSNPGPELYGILLWKWIVSWRLRCRREIRLGLQEGRWKRIPNRSIEWATTLVHLHWEKAIFLWSSPLFNLSSKMDFRKWQSGFFKIRN